MRKINFLGNRIMKLPVKIVEKKTVKKTVNISRNKVDEKQNLCLANLILKISITLYNYPLLLIYDTLYAIDTWHFLFETFT